MKLFTEYQLVYFVDIPIIATMLSHVARKILTMIIYLLITQQPALALYRLEHRDFQGLAISQGRTVT